MCASLNVIILNGCVGRDKYDGNFTFHKCLVTGQVQKSVIDYAIASFNLAPSVGNFEVLVDSDDISDHRPLVV